MNTFVLREVSDPKIVYGILNIDANIDEAALQNAISSAKEQVRGKDCWEISDVLKLLPAAWNAHLNGCDNVYI